MTINVKKNAEFPGFVLLYIRQDGTVSMKPKMEGGELAESGMFSAANVEDILDTAEKLAKDQGTTVNWAAFCYDLVNKSKFTKRPPMKRGSHVLKLWTNRWSKPQITLVDPEYQSKNGPVTTIEIG